MRILAIDTAGDTGSIALLDDTRLLEEVALTAPGGFAQALFGELRGLLERQGVGIEQIELFAAATGPGSFTGVRIGLSAIKAMAEVTGRPAIGVSNLEATAEFGTGSRRAAVIDARRGEVYAALFDAEPGAGIPPMVTALADFEAMVGTREIEWIPADNSRLLAAGIGKLAQRKFLAGAVSDPAAIEADYVRRSDAEIYWKPL